MRTVILILLMAVLSLAASAQNVLDSIQLYDYPVREGVIYKYETKSLSPQVCASSLSIVSVVTHSDSVFHFEEGKVASVFSIDDLHAIIIQNTRNEYITYSNLQDVMLRKGDRVTKGMCVGTTGESNDQPAGYNQVDIIVQKQVNQLPYRKTIEFIRSKSTPKSVYYSSL